MDLDAETLGAIVTYLEMAQRPPARPMPPSPLRLVRWPEPDPAKFRTLFARVGAPWLWFSRLAMSEERLLGIIRDPKVEVYAACDAQGVELGLLELDFRAHPETNLAFFGLVPELTGKGHGRWLMANALALGWRKGTERMTVHTCSLDHPSALNFYRAQGFVPLRRAVERFPDPRAIGLLPADAAPQIPRLIPAS